MERKSNADWVMFTSSKVDGRGNCSCWQDEEDLAEHCLLKIDQVKRRASGR